LLRVSKIEISKKSIEIKILKEIIKCKRDMDMYQNARNKKKED